MPCHAGLTALLAGGLLFFWRLILSRHAAFCCLPQGLYTEMKFERPSRIQVRQPELTDNIHLCSGGGVGGTSWCWTRCRCHRLVALPAASVRHFGIQPPPAALRCCRPDADHDAVGAGWLAVGLFPPEPCGVHPTAAGPDAAHDPIGPVPQPDCTGGLLLLRVRWHAKLLLWLQACSHTSSVCGGAGLAGAPCCGINAVVWAAAAAVAAWRG